MVLTSDEPNPLMWKNSAGVARTWLFESYARPENLHPGQDGFKSSPAKMEVAQP